MPVGQQAERMVSGKSGSKQVLDGPAAKSCFSVCKPKAVCLFPNVWLEAWQCDAAGCRRWVVKSTKRTTIGNRRVLSSEQFVSDCQRWLLFVEQTRRWV